MSLGQSVRKFVKHTILRRPRPTVSLDDMVSTTNVPLRESARVRARKRSLLSPEARRRRKRRRVMVRESRRRNRA